MPFSTNVIVEANDSLKQFRETVKEVKTAMDKPFNELPAHLRDSTCTVLSLSGVTERHAAWMRREGCASRLRAWIDEQMAAEQIATKKMEAEIVMVVIMRAIHGDYKSELINSGIKCRSCQYVHTIDTDSLLAMHKQVAGMTCIKCGEVISFRSIDFRWAK